MARKSRPKIIPTRVDKTSRLINPTIPSEDGRISFNFRRLCIKQCKFDYSERDGKYFNTLIDKLKGLSEMNKREFISPQNRNSLRIHKIDFNDPTVTEDSFGILGEDVDDDAWQFSLSSNEHGRVHGYFVESVFYPVWLDPDHNLYK